MVESKFSLAHPNDFYFLTAFLVVLVAVISGTTMVLLWCVVVFVAMIAKIVGKLVDFEICKKKMILGKNVSFLFYSSLSIVKTPSI